MKIVLMGVKGSGKGTYASRLSPILGIPHISTGQIFRENISKKTLLGEKIKEILDKGKFVSDEITLEVVKERIKKPDCEKGFIFDGFPRTLKQAEELDNFEKIDVAFYLDVAEDVILRRITTRITCRKCGEIYNKINMKPKKEGICDKCGGELYQRADDTPEAVKQRLEEDEKKVKPLIDYYRKKGILKIVRCDDFNIPPEIFVNKILEILKTIK